MPKLHIFDDDAEKLSLAELVLEELKTLSSDWTLGFHEPVQEGSSTAIDALTDPAGAVCVIDVEIKADAFGTGYNAAIDLLKQVIPSSIAGFSDVFDGYRTLFGTHDDYAWAIHAFTYTRLNDIPALVISTKSHHDNGDDLVAVTTARGIPTIANWKPEVLSAEPSRKKTAIAAIAKKIQAEWNKHRGRISGRLWPNEALDATGWFNARNTHPCVKHKFPSAPRDTYDQTIREYLRSVINPSKVTKVEFSSYQTSSVLHNALKRLVGDCARAHGGSPNERLPNMNTVVLLAAAWDPNAIEWFHHFKWQALHPLMVDSATKTDVRNAILGLGGEEGLFNALLIKDNSGDAPWDASCSNVKAVSVTDDFIRIELHSSLGRLPQNFAKAKKGQALTDGGDAYNALLSAWHSLAVNSARTIEIEVKGKSVTFKKSV